MNANEPLKRCPFCGGEATMKRHFIGQNKARYKIGCDDCGFALSWCNRQSHAVKNWNRRAKEDKT